MRRGVVTLAAALALVAPPAAAAADPQVAGLQVALAAKRLYPGRVDGIAGDATVSAIRSLQRQAELPPTGTADAATRNALGRLGRPLYGTRPIKRGMVGLDVSVLQYLLAVHGLDPGTLDGHFGPQTRDAVVGFQRRARLEPDGVAGPLTRAALADQPRHRRPPRFPVAWPVEDTGSAAVRAEVEQAAARAGISPRLALAVAWVESGYQANIRSATGDWGPMQVSAPAWDFVEEVILHRAAPHTSRGNVRVGILYLRRLLKEFGGDERLALGAYHQGAASVREHGLLPETEAYVSAIRSIAGR